MLTQRDVDAGTEAAKKVGFVTTMTDANLRKLVAAVILAVDAERSPVAITKDVLGALFAPKRGAGG